MGVQRLHNELDGCPASTNWMGVQRLQRLGYVAPSDPTGHLILLALDELGGCPALEVEEIKIRTKLRFVLNLVVSNKGDEIEVRVMACQGQAEILQIVELEVPTRP